MIIEISSVMFDVLPICLPFKDPFLDSFCFSDYLLVPILPFAFLGHSFFPRFFFPVKRCSFVCFSWGPFLELFFFSDPILSVSLFL